MHAVVVRCAFFVPQQFSRNDSSSTVQGNSKFLTRLCVKHGTMKKRCSQRDAHQSSREGRSMCHTWSKGKIKRSDVPQGVWESGVKKGGVARRKGKKVQSRRM